MYRDKHFILTSQLIEEKCILQRNNLQLKMCVSQNQKMVISSCQRLPCVWYKKNILKTLILLKKGKRCIHTDTLCTVPYIQSCLSCITWCKCWLEVEQDCNSGVNLLFYTTGKSYEYCCWTFKSHISTTLAAQRGDDKHCPCMLSQ